MALQNFRLVAWKDASHSVAPRGVTPSTAAGSNFTLRNVCSGSLPAADCAWQLRRGPHRTWTAVITVAGYNPMAATWSEHDRHGDQIMQAAPMHCG